jgi:hypothetical protein
METTVYCDEAGFTGDNLRDAQQPYFAYAGVTVGGDEAAGIIGELRRLTGSKVVEFKGKDLYKHRAAVQGAELLMERLAGRGAFVVHDKAYALAAKFYEYALEPALASKSAFFYQVGFHRFVSNLMHLFLRSGDSDAETVLSEFMNTMRRESDADAGLYDRQLTFSNDPANIVSAIVRLARSPTVQAAARDEQAAISDENGRILWLLDLTVNSASSILRHLSHHRGALRVVVDNSKPLAASRQLLEGLGSQPVRFAPAEWGFDLPLNFQLAGPIRAADSTSEPGLQLADMLASMVASAARANAQAPSAKAGRILELVMPLACPGSLYPDTTPVDLTNAEAVLNLCVLQCLAARAETNRPLLSPDLIHEILGLRNHIARNLPPM